jgi:hypothetical protein
MTGSDVSRVRDVLWPAHGLGPGCEVHAILDGARDRRIYSLLRQGLADYCCLYTGDLTRAVAEAAPYLVPLDRNSEFTARLIDLVWGQGAAIFVESPAVLTELRRHFRRFLRVRDDAGRTLLFRYYDPRVLRIYLPTCDADELRSVFGPVARFGVEDEDGSSLLSYRRTGPGLIAEVAPLGGPPLPRPEAVSAADPGPLVDELRPLRLRAEQVAAFRAAAIRRFVDRLAGSLRQNLPGHFLALGEPGVREVIWSGLRRAEVHGFTSERAVAEYVRLMLLFGHDFDADHDLPWAGRALADRDALTEDARLERLLAAARAYLTSLAEINREA